MAEITATAKTLAALLVPALVPRPLVPEDWGGLVAVDKLEATEFAELMTEEREEREELTPDGSEEGGTDENPLNVEVAEKEVVYVGMVGIEVGLFRQTSELPGLTVMGGV